MARREEFVAGGLRITTWRETNKRCFVAWKPDVSIFCQTTQEVLRFAAWPVKTPTGDALREWLASLAAQDAAKGKPANLQQDKALLKETGWGPEAHDDDGPTKMVI